MIKNVFLPATVKNFYLFTNYTVGVEINKTHICACLTKKHGSSVTVETIQDVQIEAGPANTYEKRAALALQKAVARFKKIDEIRLAISSTVVVFKELTVPFTDPEKIELILGFEVEPLLPFALSKTVIDFIITHQTPESSTILVAAVQKQYITEYFDIFHAAGVPLPSIISVDYFILYDLYLQSNFYQSLGQHALLIEVGTSFTRIGQIEQKQLKQMRNIAQGTHTIIRSISEQLSISPSQATEMLLRYGTTDEHQSYMPQLTQTLNALCDAIQFTIESFKATPQTDNGFVDIVLLSGPGIKIPGLQEFISDKLHRRCFIIEPEKFLPAIKTPTNAPIAPVALISVGITIPSATLANFNLAREDFAQTDQKTFVIQLASCVVLFLLMVTLLAGHSFIQIRALKAETHLLQNETLSALFESFPEIDATESDLKTVVEEAQAKIQAREATWFKFSREQRLSPLKYLLELTTAINKTALSLDVEQLTIANQIILLKGSVKDYNALTLLEQEINQIPGFKVIPPLPQEPDFQMKIKVLPKVEQK